MFRLLSAAIIITFNIQVSLAETHPPRLWFWDFGDTPNYIDPQDMVYDLSGPCYDTSNVLNFPGYTEFDSDKINDVVNKRGELDESPLHLLNSRYSLDASAYSTVNVHDTFLGSSDAIYILLPEVHSPVEERVCPTSNCQEKHAFINTSRSFFSVFLANKATEKGDRFSNHREGAIGGDWKLNDLDLKGKTNGEKWIAILDSGYRLTPFLTLANLFAEENTDTSYLETAEKIAADVVLSFGDFEPGMSFEEVIENAGTYFETNFNVDDLRIGYEFVSKKSGTELEALSERICYDRSIDMVNKSLQLAKENKSRLVFLGFGGSHHYGISKTLRENNITYITVSGKSAFK